MNRARRAALSAVVLAGSVAFFVVGLAIGNRHTFSWMVRRLETEVEGTMNLAIEELLLLRNNEPERAIELLDQQVNSALSTLSQGRKWEELPASTQTSLLIAKRYRETFGVQNAEKRLDRALSFVPDGHIDLDQCRPAVRRLLLGEQP